MHIKFYENRSDSDLTRKLMSVSIVCTTIDIGFGEFRNCLVERIREQIIIISKKDKSEQLSSAKLTILFLDFLVCSSNWPG